MDKKLIKTIKNLKDLSTLKEKKQNNHTLNLGKRIKFLRTQQELTLGELSKRADIAKSTISKIENSQMSPTYDLLQKLSNGFAIDLTELISNNITPSFLGRRTITRKSEGEFLKGDNFTHEFLASEITNKFLLPFVSHIRAHSIDDYDDWHRHKGEDFMYILQGSCTVYMESYKPVILNIGDSIYFDSLIGHMIISNGKQDAVALWVSTNSSGKPQ